MATQALLAQLRPAYGMRASPTVMKEIMREVLTEALAGQTYQGDQVQQQTKSIADNVKDRLKALNLPRYKYMVQVVIGEQRGEGVRYEIIQPTVVKQ
mmetsp:Transcript_30790/g.101033  ORF Transcript_30790/g.101033 Transcript_30790/m.101033 type:complete len:97 (+) Transcript_30790:2202-2492(+)